MRMLTINPMDLDRYPATGPAQAVATDAEHYPQTHNDRPVRIIMHEHAVYPTKFSRNVPPVDMPGPTVAALDDLDKAIASGKRARRVGASTVYILW